MLTVPPVTPCTSTLSAVDPLCVIVPWKFTSADPPSTQRPRPALVTCML